MAILVYKEPERCGTLVGWQLGFFSRRKGRVDAGDN